MIASLRGFLQFKALDHVVLEANGVGYQLWVSMQTLADLPAEGAEAFLFCHTHVREDVLQLFGFASIAEREAFGLLNSVSGIGPKLALTVLSGLTVPHLIEAITAGDHRRLQSVPGIGKRTAERLVVELKDRMARMGMGSGAAGRPGPAAAAGPSTEDIVDALVNLGYKRSGAERAVGAVAEAHTGQALAAEQLLRLALVAISEL